MSDSPNDPNTLMARALAALESARARETALRAECERLSAALSSQKEPVSVIGLACRFPGGEDRDRFTELLLAGREATAPFPRDRFDVEALHSEDSDEPGKIIATAGAFLSEIDQFDAERFAIAPRDAQFIDPQHRLLLETTAEALDDALLPASATAGVRAGVFIGISSHDYANRLVSEVRLEDLSRAAGTGNAQSAAAGRIAFHFGFTGPALAIDTACSSSLVALHLAVQSLRLGECDLAIVGGVNVICHPVSTLVFSRAHMLSQDGRCKTFARSADGYGRGEGVGVLVLERQRDAERHERRVWGDILGSAVNQDGRSAGLTVPNGPAQVLVMNAAKTDARIEADDVSYVEAHGTGTPLGDPMEMASLCEVYGKNRALPLHVGSVKTNIGHLEAAAGIAGLIKVLIMFREETLVPHLHFEEGNPHIPWDTIPIRIPTAAIPWSPSKPRIGAISSFGFTGTNAHVILREPKSRAPRSPVALRGPRPRHAIDGHPTPPRGPLEWVNGGRATGRVDWRARRREGQPPWFLGTPSAAREAIVFDLLLHMTHALEVPLPFAWEDLTIVGVLSAATTVTFALTAVAHGNRFELTGTTSSLRFRATLVPDASVPQAPSASTTEAVPLDPYDLLEAHGLRVPKIQRTLHLWTRRGADIGAHLDLAKGRRADATPFGHPLFLLGALHALAAAASGPLDLAFAKRVLLARSLTGSLACGGTVGASSHLTLFDDDGTVAVLEGVTHGATSPPPDAVALTWPSIVGKPLLAARRWLVLSSDEATDSLPLIGSFESTTSLATVARRLTQDPPIDHVLDLRGLRRAAFGPAAITRRVLETKELVDVMGSTAAPYTVVTRGAVRVGEGDVLDPGNAAVWALLRALDFESGTRAPRRLDVLGNDVNQLVQILAEEPAAVEIALRATRHEAVLVQQSLPAIHGGEEPWTSKGWVPRVRLRGTWILTGGNGSVGRSLFDWLLARGVERLIIASRGSSPEGIEASSDRIQHRVLDVTRREDVVALVAEFSSSLRGVIHAAGVLDDAPLNELTPARIERVLLPKIAGASFLDEATRSLELDHFVLISSAAATLGNAGQGAYLAANGALSALADARRRAGHSAAVIAFGPFNIGMAKESAQGFRRRGISPLLPEAALSALEGLLSTGREEVIAVDLDPERLGMTADLPPRFRFFARRPTGAPPPRSLRTRLLGKTVARRQALTLEWISQVVARILRLSVNTLDPERSLIDLGADSLALAEVRAAILAELSVSPSTDGLMTEDGLKGIAGMIERLAKDARGVDNDLVHDLSKLSDEEIARLLDETRDDDDF